MFRGVVKRLAERTRGDVRVLPLAAAPVELGQLGLCGTIVDREKVPALRVTAVRCPDRGVEDPALCLDRDGVLPHAPHHPGRVQGFVDIHSAIP